MPPESEDGLLAEQKPATSPEPKEDGHEQGAGPTEETHEDSEASSGDDPEEIARAKGEVKRIKRAVRDRDVERGLRAEAERENERLRAEIARARSGEAEPERKPAEQQDEPAKRRDAVEWKSKVDDFQDDGEEKYDDFAEKVIDNPRVQITKTMAQEMMDIDNGVDVAYYLGQHPKESRRIAALPERAQAREIGKLEVIVAGQAKRPDVKVSKTPRPIEPVSGGKVVSKGLKPESSMEDFIKATR